MLSFPHMHNLHAMGLFDMLTSLVPPGMNGVISPYAQHSTSTYTSSSSSGDELGGSDSPEVIIVDSDTEDTLERGRASRAPGPGFPPPRHPGSSQEIIDLTLLPDSENEDHGFSLRRFAQRSTAGALPNPPPLPTIINLDAAPSPATIHEHHHLHLPVRDDEQRRRGGRIADIIHERDV
jgi:hypothetical protein